MSHSSSLWFLNRLDEVAQLVAHGLGCHSGCGSLEVDVARAADALGGLGHKRAVHDANIGRHEY